MSFENSLDNVIWYTPLTKNKKRNRRKIMFPTISDIFRVICNEIELEEWKKGEKK